MKTWRVWPSSNSQSLRRPSFNTPSKPLQNASSELGARFQPTSNASNYRTCTCPSRPLYCILSATGFYVRNVVLRPLTRRNASLLVLNILGILPRCHAFSARDPWPPTRLAPPSIFKRQPPPSAQDVPFSHLPVRQRRFYPCVPTGREGKNRRTTSCHSRDEAMSRPRHGSEKAERRMRPLSCKRLFQKTVRQLCPIFFSNPWLLLTGWNLRLAPHSLLLLITREPHSGVPSCNLVADLCVLPDMTPQQPFL